MTPRWAALGLALALVGGCGGRPPEGVRGPDTVRHGDPDTPAAIASLSDDDLSRSWAFHDGLDPEHPFDAMLAIPGGFVAITHELSPDQEAIPERGNIALTSTDGVSWQKQALGDTVNVRSLAFGNGVIVAVGMRFGGGGGAVFTSGDGGHTWTEPTAPSADLVKVTFLEERFWVFGGLGTFFNSREGRSWEDLSRREYVQLNAIAFGLGRYLVMGNRFWLSSEEGRTWTEHQTICDDVSVCPGVVAPGGSPPGHVEKSTLLFGNGAFVTEGWVSNDGQHFTAAPDATGAGVFSHGRFLTRGEDGTISVSEDGRRWSNRTSAAATDDGRLSCVGHTCIALRNGILVVPAAGDPTPLPRLPPVDLGPADDGKTIPVKVGQRIRLGLGSRSAGGYGAPLVSSPAVRFVHSRVVGGPAPTPPFRSSQIFLLAAEAPGRAEVRVPNTGGEPDFQLTIDVTPR